MTDNNSSTLVVANDPNDPRFVNNPDYEFANGIWNFKGPADLDEVIVTAERRSAPDLRVRLRAQNGQELAVYGEETDDNILAILHETNGMLFPYTPSITFEQSVEYKTIDLTHANNDINAYTRTPSVNLSIVGKFTVQNQREGLYVLAVMHFLRTVSKMHFGELDPNAGRPPPILYFQGYGPYMFNGLKCVLKSHNYSLEDTVDYVDVRAKDGTITRLPSLLTISVNLGVQQTPNAMRKVFDLEKFRTGELMRTKKGWI